MTILVGQPSMIDSMQQIQKMKESFEDDLILSRLPYPKYYNGHEWNTIVDKSRKNIPSYLQSDLPSLKYQHLRQRFQKINEFGCPRLTYFNSYILRQKKRILHPHLEYEIKSKEERERSGKKTPIQRWEEEKKRELAQVREAMKYSLLTSNKNSNVLTGLLKEGNKIEEELRLKKKRGKRRGQSLSERKIKKSDKCFEETLEIVLALRKQEMCSNPEKKPYDGENLAEEMEKRIGDLKLEPLQL